MSTAIHDAKGNVIGYQDRDGTLRDRNKKKIGSINRRNGTVVDNHNVEVGFVDGDGNVIDRYRRRVGTITADGTVQDWHGVEMYEGSAAPLLLDFEDRKEEAFASVRPEVEPVDDREPTTPGQVIRGALVQEGFVSPSVIGCLGIIGAIIVGSAIIFFLQNPSFFTAPSASPTPALVAAETLSPENEEGPPVVEDGTTPEPSTQALTGTVNTQILNLREGPSTDVEIVDRLQMNTEVVFEGRTENVVWIKVTVPSISKEGWVAAEYINTEVDLSSLPVVEAPAP